MKVLVVGGCGYIGSKFISQYNTVHKIESVDLEWYGNPGVKNRKEDYGDLTKEDLSVYDAVIAIAGYSSDRSCVNIPGQTLENNVINFFNLCKAITGKTKLIFSSSCRVYYGSDLSSNNKEEDLRFCSSAPYDMSMYFRERIAQNFDFEYYGLRLATVNGPSKTFRRESMINSLVDSYSKRGFMQISGSENRRSILDIYDAVRAFDAILKNGEYSKRGIYNLVSFNSTVRELGEEASKICRCPLLEDKSSYAKVNFSMDGRKFNKTFNYEPLGSVETIVTDIIADYDNMFFTDRIEPVEYIKR